MPTGRIQPPNLDDRNWQDIVDEMIGNIPKVAPEWTDHNPSDLGIAMIELFAWMAEMIIYRLNQVPEKNYIAFLNLLDITRDPPTPATVELTFEISEGNIIIPKGTQVSTKPTEQEEAIIFETDKQKILTETDNKIMATNALTIRQPEIIGLGTGEVFQVYSVKNTPIYPEPDKPDPFSHLEVRVKDIVWTRVVEFKESQNKHYRCNPITGEIIFGDGNFGGIPGVGDEIKMMSYRYTVGGMRSNLPPYSLTLLKTPIAGVKSVTNETAAYGGSDWEEIEETKRRAPQQIKSRYRAVTKEDYEFLAKEATNEVAKVRCLGPKKKVGGGYENTSIDRQLGKVNLIIVPKVPYNPDNPNSRKPIPSDDLMNEIISFLEPRRVLTSELILNNPFYVEIGVEATVFIPPGEDKKEIENEVIDNLIEFFHPVSGGYHGTGWEIGEDVYLPQVFESIIRHPKISFIKSLVVKRADGNDTEGVRIEIKEHELVCAADPDPVKNNFKITVEIEEQEA